MYKKITNLLALFILMLIPKNAWSETFVSFTIPSATTNVGNPAVTGTDANTGYSYTYYNFKNKNILDSDGNQYYELNSGMGSYAKVEAPEGDSFRKGDQVTVLFYTEKNNKTASVYSDEAMTTAIYTQNISTSGAYTATFTLTADTRLIYIGCSYSINSYIAFRGMSVSGSHTPTASLASFTLGGVAGSGNAATYSVNADDAATTAIVNYTKKEGLDVNVSMSALQSTPADNPATLTYADFANGSTVAIPTELGGVNYYYMKSSLNGYDDVYYTLTVKRKNTADAVYNYDFTVSPITSTEDPTLANISQNGNYHSSHGWRFNYISGADETLQVKVEGDAIIKLRGCTYNDPEGGLTATVADNTGSIVPSYKVTPIKDCNGYNTFFYKGKATTLTFTYSDKASYLSYLTIDNEGTGEQQLRGIAFKNSILQLSDFTDGTYNYGNLGYIGMATPEEKDFPVMEFATKSGCDSPAVTTEIDHSAKTCTYSFTYNNKTYKLVVSYESEPGYTEDATNNRYDVTTPYGLKTIIAAMNNGTASKYTNVYIEEGTYDMGGNNNVNYLYGIQLKKSGITIEGAGMEKTILQGKYTGVVNSILNVAGDNAVIKNMTIENTIGNNGVAPALSASGANVLFDNCKIISWQDTYVGGKNAHLFKNCIIAGAVDFICGGGTDYFVGCTLKLQNRKDMAICAPQGKQIFRDCTIENMDDANSMDGKYGLGRPWNPGNLTGQTCFFINTTYKIKPNVAFKSMSGNVFAEGLCGTYGDKDADGNAFTVAANENGTAQYTLTDADVTTYSSIFGLCGSILFNESCSKSGDKDIVIEGYWSDGDVKTQLPALTTDATITSIDLTGNTGVSAKPDAANKNILVFSDRLANGNNIVKSDNTCQTLSLSDGDGNFSNHRGEFTASTVTFNRTFSAGETTTISLPFALTESEVKTIGGTFYTIGNFDAEKHALTFCEAASTEANVPYLFVASKDGVLFGRIASKEIPLSTEMTVTTTDGDASMTGTTILKSIKSDASNTLYTYKDNSFKRADIDTETTVNPFCAYITVKGASTDELSVSLNNISTGIRQTAEEMDDKTCTTYDLLGRSVNGDKAHLKHGLYIMNGRKIIVK